MQVVRALRSALLVAAVLGMCATTTIDAKKIKLCEADHPAPTPAKSTLSPVVIPTSTPVTFKPGNDGKGTQGPSAAPATQPPATFKPGNDGKGTQGPSAAPATQPPATVKPGDDGAPGTVGPAKPTPGPAPAPVPAPAPNNGAAATNAGTIKAAFTYKGGDAGGRGTYQMVTDVNTCAKTPRTLTNPVSPLDDDLTFVFRGPMTIHNIAIFDGRSGAWTKVSSYTKGGASNNLVFMNNRNIDFGGKSAPQGFATADGRGKADKPTQFAGELGAATNPNGFTVYADEKTGAEVNIFQDKRCGQGVDCPGYYDKDGTALYGWDGPKKIFITKVQMPHGGAPNLPAIWALNGQIVRSNQYQCNCRGMGGGGGCGEFDIAEVIEKDVNVVATHYYKYEGGTGHDSWGKRPTNAPTTYVTIIDDSFGVKVLEIGPDDFDFNAGTISNDVLAKWKSS